MSNLETERDPGAPPARGPRRVRLALAVVVLGLTGVGAGMAVHRDRPRALEGPGYRITLEAEVRTGHQRAERLAFFADGSRLAVICPRYDRLMLYRVTDSPGLELERDVKLDGRPVSLAARGDRLVVLQRPAGDARHIEAAWWDVFDPHGERVGERLRVGYDPDDMAFSEDGQLALVVLSGNAEGEGNRPAPVLQIVDVTDLEHPRIRGAATFDRPKEDPERLAVRGTRAAVALRRANTVAEVDFADPDRPVVVERRPLPRGIQPGAVQFDRDGRLLVADEGNERLQEITADGHAEIRAMGAFAEFDGPDGIAWRFALSVPRSAVEVLRSGTSLGRVSLGGIGGVRPTDLAIHRLGDAEALIAVSDRSGGVHLLRLDERAGRP